MSLRPCLNMRDKLHDVTVRFHYIINDGLLCFRSRVSPEPVRQRRELSGWKPPWAPTMDFQMRMSTRVYWKTVPQYVTYHGYQAFLRILGFGLPLYFRNAWSPISTKLILQEDLNVNIDHWTFSVLMNIPREVFLDSVICYNRHIYCNQYQQDWTTRINTFFSWRLSIATNTKETGYLLSGYMDSRSRESILWWRGC